MRFSLFSLGRVVLAAMLVCSAAAIGLARLAPAPKGWRMPCSPRYTSVNAFFLDQCRRGSIWVDRDGGPGLDLPFRDGELLEYASLSPWRDDQGDAQVVGRWSWGFRVDSPETSYGLARLSFPDGKVLDHIETDVVPVSAPCWYPGGGARVLFAAGDGKLYQYDFGTAEREGHSEERGREGPRALAWNCPAMDEDSVYLSEPNWSSDPRFAHLLFVGLRRAGTSQDHPASKAVEAWWLRLSDDGDSIEEAGRLIDSPTDGEDTNERCPTLALAPGGRPVLAYYRRSRRRLSELHVVPIELDPDRGIPRTVAGPGTKVADDCLTTPPIVSRDGQWIGYIQGIGGYRGTVRRIPLDLGTGSAATSAVAEEDDTARR